MFCLHCTTKTTNKKFCSRSCAVSCNNVKFPRRKLEGKCFSCAVRISSRVKYCAQCRKPVVRNKAIVEEWLCGKSTGSSGKNEYRLNSRIRQFLLEKTKYACSKCGWSKKHSITNLVPLEINHINGDSKNHSPSNLEVLCPNCHALTPTYRALNKGNGRPYTRYRP